MQMKDYTPGKTFYFAGAIWNTPYGGTPSWSDADMAAHGYTKIMDFPLVFTVPADFNAVLAEVTGIDKSLEAASATYHSTVSNLRRRKEQLLQLGHDELLDAAPAHLPQQSFKDISEADADLDIPF